MNKLLDNDSDAGVAMKLLRPMRDADIDAVVALIETHDEDDAEEAQRFYREFNGCFGQFVLEQQGEVVGVTGFEAPTGCEQTYWINWTYIDASHCNRGLGRRMLTELFDYLEHQQGARKLFVKVSDYVDPEDGPLYAAALHLYQSMGFAIEVEHRDFYAVGEAQIILGRRMQPGQQAAIEEQRVAIQFNEIFEIGETEGSWSFGWHEQRKRGADAPFTVQELQTGLDAVRAEGARVVFLSFPSDYAGIREPLLEAGFGEAGKLLDYYADGIDELHYAFTF
ncbi:MAG: GNAT family N-acetyltransferase [Pseudomonadota bacterium]